MQVAEACLRNVTIEGSLLVHADNVLGHWEAERSAAADDTAPSGSNGAAAPAAGASAAWRTVSSGDSMDGAGDCAFVGGNGNGNANGGAGQRLVYSSRCGRVLLDNVQVTMKQ